MSDTNTVRQVPAFAQVRCCFCIPLARGDLSDLGANKTLAAARCAEMEELVILSKAKGHVKVVSLSIVQTWEQKIA